MDTPFSVWLDKQMRERGWSQADLSRATGLTRQAIANYANGRIPDTASILEIARGLKLPSELVFKAAIGESFDADKWVEEQAHKMSLLTPGKRPIAERLLNALLEEDQQASKVTVSRKAKTA